MLKRSIFFILAIILSFLFFNILFPGKKFESISSQELEKRIRAGEVKTIALGSNYLKISLWDNREQTVPLGEKEFWHLAIYNQYPLGGVTLKNCDEMFQSVEIIILFFFLLLLTVIWFFISDRAIRREKLIKKCLIWSPPDFAQIKGYELIKGKTERLLDLLKDPKRVSDLDISARSIFVMGPSGAGKTLFGKALAGQAGVPLLYVEGAEILEKGVGLFLALIQKANKIGPCVIFIDEVLPFGLKNKRAKEALGALLAHRAEIKSPSVLVISTSDKELVHHSLLVNFPLHIKLRAPHKEARLEILRALNAKASVEFLEYLAERTIGFTAGQLKKLMEQISLAQSEEKSIIDDILSNRMGECKVLSDEQKRRNAFHEAGHVLLALLLKIDIISSTIIPLKNSGGCTTGRRRLVTKQQLLNDLILCFGGMRAESEVFGDISIGCQNDLEDASRMAIVMVSELGMGKGLLYVSFTDPGSRFMQFLTANRHLELEKEASELLNKAHKEAAQLVQSHLALLREIAVKLLEKEILAAADFEDFSQKIKPMVRK